jgi:uncharacterized protein YegL
VSPLQDFTIASARPLPVIVLADVSGSMREDGKIQTLNTAVVEMIAAFAEEDDYRAEIQIAVVTFGKGGARLHLPLAPASHVSWADMAADGKTPLGAAIDLTTSLLEDREMIPSRAYRPTVILVSDGQPTDEWREPLERMLGSERASKASRFAMLIGADEDPAVLGAFVGTDEEVIRAHEARRIKQFFRLVTMSVTSRSRSANPNTVSKLDPTDLDALEF